MAMCAVTHAQALISSFVTLRHDVEGVSVTQRTAALLTASEGENQTAPNGRLVSSCVSFSEALKGGKGVSEEEEKYSDF